ncbi:regulatory protein, luxR family, partial [Streptomyces sp. Ncost-T6T-2b]
WAPSGTRRGPEPCCVPGSRPRRAVRPGARRTPTSLSPREAEVAQLASSGLTNREIAATLHLSPRTVEQHIAGAMRKTGALSRRDLAHRI